MLYPDDTAGIAFHIFLIAGMIGKNKRDVIFFRQMNCSPTDQYRMVYMDNIEFLSCKFPVDPPVKRIRQHNAADEVLHAGGVAENILLLLLFLVGRGKDRHLVSERLKTPFQPLNRDRHTTNIRFIVVCHQCNFHVPFLPLALCIVCLRDPEQAENTVA